MSRMMPLTPISLTMTLAYCHHYTPNFLPGRCLPPTDLQTLTVWLDNPYPVLRSVRANPQLALHLALGCAADLLTVAAGRWQTTHRTLAWLEMPHQRQLAHLQAALADRPTWEAALATLSLQELFDDDYLTYVAQQLACQQAEPPPLQTDATWLPDDGERVWRLTLPPALRPDLLFHLLQMGTWLPGSVWEATPYSIALAAQRGYSLTRMEIILMKAVGQPLSAQQQAHLVAWYNQHDAYRLRPAYLLSVKEPKSLDDIFAQRRWRAHLGSRLSRRHAVVSPQIVPLLRRHLKQMGFVLDAPLTSQRLNNAAQKGVQSVEQNAADSWLALEVLAGLSKLIPLPFSLSLESRFHLAERLTQEQQATLTQKAEEVLAGLRDALQGRDAYFAAERPVADDLVTTIRAALSQERALEITYQGLGETAPRVRRVEPHRLEEQSWGLYLHAYCYLAEGERVFRLDRIHDWRMIAG